MSTIHRLASAFGAALLLAGTFVLNVGREILATWVEASRPGEMMRYWK